jgi:hypothetical protein
VAVSGMREPDVYPSVLQEQCFMSGGPWDGSMQTVARGYEPNGDGSFRKATIDIIKIAGEHGEYRRNRDWTTCFDWYESYADQSPALAPDKRTRFRDQGLAEALWVWLISPTQHADDGEGYERARGEIARLIGGAGYHVRQK